MYYVCKGCDDCCRSCCHCCEECCGDCCDAIAKCFSTPFSFCAFITFFVSVVPFIIMLIALAQSKDYDCEGNLKTVMIIQGTNDIRIVGVNNLLNFIFCVYLTCQYGVRGKRIENEMELSFLEKTANLILYDWVVCLYILALIFFFVWMIVGFNSVSNESSTSLCRTENNGIVITATLINLWMLVIYLIAGLIIFLWTVVLYACDDGGCSCGTMGRCCCFVITCGACDLQKDKKKEKQSKEQRVKESQQVKEKYDDNRKGWISSSKRMFGFLGIGQSQQLQQNQNINNMNNNNMHTDYRQPQPQQQQPPQQPAKSFWSFLDIFKSNNNPPPQTNQQYQAPQVTQPQYTQQNLFIQPQQQQAYQQPQYQQPQYQQPPQQFQQQQPYYYQQPNQQQPQNAWGR